MGGGRRGRAGGRAGEVVELVEAEGAVGDEQGEEDHGVRWSVRGFSDWVERVSGEREGEGEREEEERAVSVRAVETLSNGERSCLR